MNNVNSNTKESLRDYWQTPQWLVNQVANILKVEFVLDPCADYEYKKGWLHISEHDNGLVTNWKLFISEEIVPHNPAVFVNPPFSQLNDWIDKIIEESIKGLTVCLLHPDTPDTGWYQKIEKHCFCN